MSQPMAKDLIQEKKLSQMSTGAILALLMSKEAKRPTMKADFNRCNACLADVYESNESIISIFLKPIAHGKV